MKFVLVGDIPSYISNGVGFPGVPGPIVSIFFVSLISQANPSQVAIHSWPYIASVPQSVLVRSLKSPIVLSRT